jgi:hypothetical protein
VFEAEGIREGIDRPTASKSKVGGSEELDDIDLTSTAAAALL